MNEIVCATRGGQGSRAVRLRALERAAETDRGVVYFFAMDTSSLGNHDDSLNAAIRDEFNWQGRVLLEIARSQAEAAGIPAKIVIREGRFRDELVRLLGEVDASLCLLGAPRGTTRGTIGDDPIERLAEDIERASDVPVEIAHPEDLIDAGHLP